MLNWIDCLIVTDNGNCKRKEFVRGMQFFFRWWRWGIFPLLLPRTPTYLHLFYPTTSVIKSNKQFQMIYFLIRKSSLSS